MLFQNQDSSLKLEVFNYELPADGGAPDSDDRNWLVLRCTWIEDGEIHKDSNSCLLTYELREMTAGLKVVKAGIRDLYVSDFQEGCYFSLGVRALDTPRYVLQRRVETVDTPFGPVRRKFSQGYGVRREKWEYEDLARIAREQDLSLPEVRAALDAALPDD